MWSVARNTTSREWLRIAAAISYAGPMPPHGEPKLRWNSATNHLKSSMCFASSSAKRRFART
jgi:hypothetical protein